MAASESPIRRPIPEKDTHDGVGRLPWSISNSTWSFFQTPTQLGKQEYVHTLKLKSMRQFRDAHQSVVPRSIPILVTLAIRVMMMHDEWSIGWRQALNAFEPILNHYCPTEQIKTCELLELVILYNVMIHAIRAAIGTHWPHWHITCHMIASIMTSPFQIKAQYRYYVLESKHGKSANGDWEVRVL